MTMLEMLYQLMEGCKQDTGYMVEMLFWKSKKKVGGEEVKICKNGKHL